MQVTKVLLQVDPDVENFGCIRYQQQFQPTNKAKQKFLPSALKYIQAAVPGGTL